MKYRYATTLLAAGLATSVACSSDDTQDPANSGPITIDSFELQFDGPIDQGDTVEVVWSVSNANRIVITQEGDTLIDTTRGAGRTNSGALDGDASFTLTATNDDSEASETITFDGSNIRGIRIVSFSASQLSVRSGDVVELSWEIGGIAIPEQVTILDENDNVPVDGNDIPIDPARVLVGSVMVQVVGDLESGDSDVETFTLTVAGGGRSDDATVSIDVEVALPVIEVFRTDTGRSTYAFDSEVGVTWTVRNTDEVRVLWEGDGACTNFRSPGPNGMNSTTCTDPTGMGRFTVRNPTHKIILQARNANTPNEEDYVTAEIDIDGVTAPMVNAFEVDKTSFWLAEDIVTFSWDVSDADEVALQRFIPENGQFETILGASTDPVVAAQTVIIRADEVDQTTNEVRIRLLARRIDDMGQDVAVEDPEVQIAANFIEPEPNASLADALTIPADGRAVRGNIEDANDEDWFRVTVEQGQRLNVRAGFGDYDPFGLDFSCQTDTSLQILDATGAALGPVVEDNSMDWLGGPMGQPPPDTCAGGGEPAEIRAGQQGYVLDMAAGEYIIVVTGDVGNYELVAELTDAATTPPPGSVVMRVGSPTWDIRDVNLVVQGSGSFNTVMGNPGPLPFQVTVAHGLPNHFFDGGTLAPGAGGPWDDGIFSAILSPTAAHDLNYGQEWQAGLQLLGVTFNQESYPPEAFGNPTDNDSLGFALVYTAVPSITNTVTGSAQDYALTRTSSIGPIVPRTAFPLVAQEQVIADAFDSTIVVWDENSPFGMDRNPLEYPAEAYMPGEFDGTTHVHFMHMFSRRYFGAMADPFEGMTPDGLFSWTVNLRDAAGDGYDIFVPIQIAP
jgi:hypothetical protein